MLATDKRVDPRALRTHALLIEAFKVVLLERPFEEITIQDIASQATVNRATFYAHFPDKYALVDELIREDFAQLLSQRLQARTDSAQGYLRILFLSVADHWDRHTGKCQSKFDLFASLMEAQIKMQLRDNIHTWLRTHLPPRAQQKQNLVLAATLLSWSIYGAATEWHQRARNQSAERFADAAIPLLAAMVTALED